MRNLLFVLCLALLSCVTVNEENEEQMNNPGMPGNRKVGWSASGKLVTGDRTRQVTLQADFQAGQNLQQAESYILQFNKINNPSSNLPIRAEALVKWSVEGNSVSRRVSIANGVAIVGASQAVRVVLTDVTQDDLDKFLPIIPNGVEYEVSVQVTPGTRGTPAYPPVLVPIQGIARNIGTAPLPSFVTVPIPEDAGVNSVMVVASLDAANIPPALPAGGLLIRQVYTVPPFLLAEYEYECQCGRFIPIVPGTQAISVSFIAAAFPPPPPFGIVVRVTVFFGIEG